MGNVQPSTGRKPRNRDGAVGYDFSDRVLLCFRRKMPKCAPGSDSDSNGILNTKLPTTIWASIRSLHNLKHDISEATNIAGDNPDVRKRLSVLWEDWNKPNVEPTFAGLMMRKGARRKQNSGSSD